MKSLVEKILKESPDPLNVRKSTALVFNNLKLISINLSKIEDVAKIIREKIDKKQVLTEEQFGSANPTPQLIFVLDTLNFCFWAKKDEEKWTIEYPKSNYISNGWFALVACIDRAQKEGVPILNASYLKNATFPDIQHIFRSSNNTEIPLLRDRVKVLNETGKILMEKYNGDIYNLLAATGLNAGKIACEVAKNFPSFSDFSLLDNKEKMCFYKRAQIFAYDISLLHGIKAKNLESLTAFADYKIPQILRALGIIEYKTELANKVDNYIILKSGSNEEIEIRASTIWACELLAKEIVIDPVWVDNALWKMSQSLKDVKPYHRVLSTKY